MSISRRKRKEVYKRDGGKCRRCKTDKNLTIDHVVPKSMGGHNGITNMQTLCKKCNLNKGGRVKLYTPSFRKQRAYVERWETDLKRFYNDNWLIV